MDAIDEAIAKAKLDPRPSLILCRTIIGYGLPTRAGTSKAHGEPPGDDELNAAKSAAGWPIEPRFFIPDDVREHFLQAVSTGQTAQKKWEALFAEYAQIRTPKGG